MSEYINAWLLAVTGDPNPGQELKVGIVGHGYDKHEGTWEPGSLGKRDMEHGVEGEERKVLFRDILGRASLEAEPREHSDRIREALHACFVL